ncbi:hypothetical protein ACQ859_25145 [Roseateles chitinivorans]|uniref:hypothetical protein n=1 Tax=Roseateles chitinivorans TaxID=2917965 RepID=UPI003D676A24
MVLSDVLLHPSEYDDAAVMAPWTPLLGDEFELLHTTIFGSLFLVDRLGRVFLLDSWSGQLLGVSVDFESYKASVAGAPEFFRSWFMTDLAELLAANGVNRMAGQVYAPLVSPALGGSLEVRNFSLAPARAYVATSAAEVLALPRR